MSFRPNYWVDKCSEDAMKKFALQDIIRNSPQAGFTDNRGETTIKAVEDLGTRWCVLSSTALYLLYFVVFVVWCRR